MTPPVPRMLPLVDPLPSVPKPRVKVDCPSEWFVSPECAEGFYFLLCLNFELVVDGWDTLY